MRHFLAVVRTGSLIKAAKVMRVDESTVRRRIGRLERDVGAKLLQKIDGGLRVTSEGTKLLDAAQAVALRIESAEAEIAGDSAMSGTVRVGAPDGIGSLRIAPALAQLQRSAPGLRIELVTLSRVADIARREVDLAIVHRRPEGGSHHLRKLPPRTLRLYAARRYLSAHPPILSAADLAAHRFIAYVEDSDYADTTLGALKEMGIIAVPVFRSSNIIAQARAAAAGAGLALLPSYVIEPGLDLVAVLPDEVTIPLNLWLLIHADIAKLSRAKAIADAMAAACK